MKIEQKRKTVVSSHEFKSEKFTIDQSEIGFVINLLRSKLYSDKILAPIREYTTNAIDAHTDSNQRDRAIRVTLPTQLEPVFKVRDFGNGLSEEEIYDIYIKYCKSTKRNSNDGIGGLGIGCKSAFAYTDAFTIVSVQNGNMAIYNACIDEHDNGKMDKMGESATEEPNGVEIQISVRNEDIDSWRRKALELFSFFSVKPEITNLGEYEKIVKYDSVLTQDNWRIIEGIRGNGGCYVVMGNIGYEVDPRQMSGLTEQETSILWISALHIHLDIGDVDIAPSREALEYTKRTIKVLKENAEKIAKDVHQMVSDKLSSSKDLWEAKLNHSQVMNTLPDSLRRAHRSGFTWKNIQVDNTIFEHPRSKTGYNYEEGIEVRSYTFGSRYYSDDFKRVNSSQDRNIYVATHTKIAINDCDSSHGMSQRVKTLFLEDDHLEKVVVLTFDDDAAKKKFYDYNDFDKVDDSRIIRMSTIEKAKVVRGARGAGNSRAMTKVFSYKLGQTGAPSLRWADASIDLEEGGIYVPIFKFKPVDSEGEYVDFDYLDVIINGMKDFFNEEITIYGIRKRDCEKLDKKEGEWINATTLGEKIWKKMAADKKFLKELSKAKKDETVSEIECSSQVMEKIQKLLTKEGVNNEITKLVNAALERAVLERDPKFYMKRDRMQGLTKYLGKEEDLQKVLDGLKNPINLKELREKIREKFPMLSYINFYSTYQFEARGSTEKFVQYIKHMDELEKCRTK